MDQVYDHQWHWNDQNISCNLRQYFILRSINLPPCQNIKVWIFRILASLYQIPIHFSFTFYFISLHNNSHTTRSNDTAAQVTDPLELPRGPITRARAKKFKEALLNLMKTNYLKDFKDDEMKKGTGRTTYACMTIVVHEDWSFRRLCLLVYFVK